MRIQASRRSAFLLLSSFFFISVAASGAQGEIGDLDADSVIGQSTFTDSMALPIGPASVARPTGIAIDAINDRVYVSDSLNHRVLGWSSAAFLASGASADLVIGQPDFFSYGCNRSSDGSKMPVTLDSLCDPAGLAVDGAGALYVVDSSNCRVLVFDDPYANDTTADRVLGQADGSCNGTIVNANRLFIPRGVVVDAAGNVYVADGLCRVVEFDGPLAGTDATADRVYGQVDFTHTTCTGVYFPQSLAFGPSGELWVGSTYLVYEFDNPLGGPAARPQANRSLGSTNGCNTNGETSSSTCFPGGVASDSVGRLFVADAVNSRVLQFDSPLTVNQASKVFGQSSFGPPPGGTTFCGNEACNVGGASASSLCMHNYSGNEISCGIYSAAALAVDGAGGLWVADGFNNRVLRYDQAATGDRVADLVLGQSTMTSTREPVVPLKGPSIGLSEWNFEAIAIDTDNSRLLVYGGLGKYGNKPVAVFGQPDVSSSGCNKGGVSARSLCNPTAAVVGNNYLWVADTGNNRVLRFDPPWLEWDYVNQRYIIKRDADHVFGQPDFKSNTCRRGADGLCRPQGLAVDAHSNLYISDSGNNRILVDENPLTTDKYAERVFGQASFEGGGCEQGAGGATSVCDPRALAVLSHVDPWGIDQGDDLYIADRGNNRVVLYANVLTKPAGEGLDEVFGQAGSPYTGKCGQGADGLCAPTGVAVDRGGNLLVADTANNRVLEFIEPLTDTKADRVFGQPDFKGSSCNAGGQAPASDSLCQPAGVAASGAYEGNVLVADTGNNRILRFEAPYCIESFSLTAENRRDRGIRSKPLRTKLTIESGLDPSIDDDTFELSDNLVLLENDGAVYANDGPLFTLSTDSSFATDVVFNESVPPWISNVRATESGGVWSTGDLEASRGITSYQITTSFYIPPGLSDDPQRDRIKYKATAVGMDLSAFTPQSAWLRAQFGSTCFITELSCRGASGRMTCSRAR